MNILNLVENFNNIEFSFLNKKVDISLLKPYIGKNKILMIGYNKNQTNIDSISDFSTNKIKKLIDNYDLFVVGPKINYQTRKVIKDLLKLFKSKKKDFIFYGYKSYLNLNLDNSKNMFRPIDITKEPFSIKNYKVLERGIKYYYFIQYLILIFFTIYLNIKFSKILYKILTIIVFLFALFIPFKNILYIKND